MLRHRAFINQLVAYASLLITFLLLTNSVAHGQGGGTDSSGTGGRHSISGRLVFPSGQRADLRLRVRLESSGAGDLTVLSDNNGRFSFQALVPGNYTVVIEGGEFFETVREPVFIESATVTARRVAGSVPISRPFNVHVYLREKTSKSSSKPGVLNAAMANVPKVALEHYERGLAAVNLGQADKAIEEFKQAIAIYTSFGLAYYQLGVQHLKKRELSNASEALAKAIALTPEEAEPRLNYGIVLLNQKRFAEAEMQLRAALRKLDSVFTGHLYLGITLIYIKNYTEAESELKRAIDLGGTKAGQAHYYLGGLYWQTGNYRRAAVELEQYLKLEPKASNADRIRNTIKELRDKSEE
jgi:tetratricopeptide (TPR) repeat protein